ncbi:S9 family peptidase [bacterium]|nr:S9 family peptidase [bacterium]
MNWRRETVYIFIFILLVGLSSLCGKKKEDPSLLTLDRIYDSDEFSPERFGAAKWLKNGKGYTTLEESSHKGKDIIRYNPETGKKKVLVPAKMLIPEGKSEPLKIADYKWLEDRKKLLIFTNTERVWRVNSRGDYWVLNLETNNLEKLGKNMEPSSLMFAKFSPSGNRVAYVHKDNIYVESLDEHKILQLTQDGSELISNGTSDWVYEEEFRLRDGYRWSPDGEYIAYWQIDDHGVGTYYLVNYTDSIYPQLTPIRYPKVGTTNPVCKIGVINSRGGETTWFNLPGSLRDHYVPRMEWIPHSREVIFQSLNRLQNVNKVMVGNINTGEVNTIFEDKDKAWVEVMDDFIWLDEGKKFLWLSERDGRRHAYLVSIKIEEAQLITPGKYDVINIEKVDEEKGWLYFIASPHDPTRRYLYRQKLDGRGQPEKVTPDDFSGTNNYKISSQARWAFHTHTCFDTPPVTDLIRLPDHKLVKNLVDNAELKEKVEKLKRSPAEFFRIEVEENVLLDAWSMKPYNLDKHKKYPLLVYVYGEPAGQTVLDRWGGKRYLWHLMLTQQGYVVVSIDNRGTPAPRGREWRKCIYRQIGILASRDQAAAVRKLAEKRDYVDSERIGVWGWSGGGSMSLNAIFRYPNLYNTAMAVAYVSNQRFYDTIYQERYMGLPKNNNEGYKKGSPVTYAHQLKGDLLLVHGTADDNVHYQSTEVLINELIRHNKKFTLVPYPNRSHSISEGKNTRRHLFGVLTSYLKNHLQKGPK